MSRVDRVFSWFSRSACLYTQGNGGSGGGREEDKIREARITNYPCACNFSSICTAGVGRRWYECCV